MPILQRGARIGSSGESDRWLVLRKLGEGQFAEVYECRDTSIKEQDARVRA